MEIGHSVYSFVAIFYRFYLQTSRRRTRSFKGNYFRKVLARHALHLSNTQIVTSFTAKSMAHVPHARADTYNYTRVTEKHNYLLGKSSDRLNSIHSVSRTHKHVFVQVLYSRSIQISPSPPSPSATVIQIARMDLSW